VVINGLVTKDDAHLTDYRVLDFSDSLIIRSTVDKIHERLGQDVDIYAVGFSLGANHILRYLGAHHHDSGIKAAASVSNPFDVLATTINLKYRFFGLYDYVIRIKLAEPFL
jgi:predicted alpha/beta-fold hydrolase